MSLLRTGFDARNVKACLTHLKFIHPYGTLGYRPFIDERWRDYKVPESNTEINVCSKGIKIIDRTKPDGDSDELRQAREEIGKADRIILLGFGYDKTNLERLALTQTARLGTQIVGTTYKMSKMDIARAKGRVARDEFIPRDCTCMGMFDDYVRLDA